MAISTTHDIVPDSPTNTFATWNVLRPSSGTISDGNLKVLSGGPQSECTFQVDSGKWYFEYLSTNEASPNENEIFWYSPKSNAYAAGYLSTSGAKDVDNAVSLWGATWGVGDIIGSFIDCSTKTVTFYKNGISQGSLTFTSTLPVTPSQVRRGGSGTVGGYINFGQDPTFGGNKNTPATVNGVTGPFAPSGTAAGTAGLFYYPPPTGALALCTANLPSYPDLPIDPALDDLPSDYFKAVTYTGNFPTATSVDVGFNPDLIWLKSRTQTYSHGLWDTIRTVNGYEQLSTNTTSAQPTSGDEISFITNGFRIDTGQAFNESGQGSNNMVAWCFRAGGAPSGSTSTTGSAKRINTSGTQDDTSCSALASAASATITPTLMSINQKAGFSIVQWTANQLANATIPHGLGAVPKLIILKCMEVTGMHWAVYHPDTGGTNNGHLNSIILNGTGAASSNANYWSNTAPTSSVFTTGTDAVTGYTGKKFIGYVWSEIDGFSAFGSYTGNGSTDGPFVYTGFKPAWVMVKQSSASGEGWTIHDNARGTYNENDFALYPNLSNAESSGTNVGMDFLSNGFKQRETATNYNQISTTYIYAAFAEMPFRYSATNAR